MKIFNRDGNPQPTKLQQRVEKIGTTDLVMWAENALYVIGKGITQYQRSNNAELLEEAHEGAEALLAITTELKKRNANG
jgi:hypothetical protein